MYYLNTIHGNIIIMYKYIPEAITWHLIKGRISWTQTHTLANSPYKRILLTIQGIHSNEY